ncbi:MAG TPA: Na(+)-translocating NADH-quinone reductase subunit E [Gammaproteobacteria bacterium]|jgi:hypothetical protein|nr:Na(+)-translocating NADH-quinone reductase subunit E [Gammaproteobacteria bacterium]
MQVFIATFVVLMIAIVAMAVGVLLSNKRLKGSCGGLSAVGIEKTCACENPCDKRQKLEKNQISITHLKV